MKGLPYNNDLLAQYFKVPGRTRYTYSKPVAMDFVPCLLHPLVSIPVLPNGKYTIDLTALVQSFASKSPLLGGFNLRIYAFSCPDRLYVPELRENWTALTYNENQESSNETFMNAQYPVVRVPPQITQTDTVTAENNSFATTLAPGSIYEMTGLPTGYANRLVFSMPTASSQGILGAPEWVCALPILQYYHIFQNYFLNSSDDEFRMIFPPSDADFAHSTPYYDSALRAVPSKTLNSLFSKVQGLGFIQDSDPRGVPRDVSTWLPAASLDASWSAVSVKIDRALFGTPYGGLCVKSLPQDLINAYVAPQAYERSIAKSLVALSDGKLDMQSLLDGRRLYNFYTKAMYGGGRFDQFIYSEYGIDIRQYLDIPLFLRSWSVPVSVGMIMASASGAPNGSSSQRDSIFGELGGLGSGRRSGMRMTFSAKEPGSLVFLACIEPTLLYRDVVDPFAKKFYFADRFTPSFDRMGLQPVPQDRVSWGFANPDFSGNVFPHAQGAQINPKFPSMKPVGSYMPVASSAKSAQDLYSNPFSQNAIGYQPSWSEYTSSYGRVRGRLATDLSYWALIPQQDRFTVHFPGGPGELPSWGTSPLAASSLSAYYNPVDYLESFVSDFISDSPFVGFIGCDIRADIPVSRSQLDNL